jgi:hypothetical protein
MEVVDPFPWSSRKLLLRFFFFSFSYFFLVEKERFSSFWTGGQSINWEIVLAGCWWAV